MRNDDDFDKEFRTTSRLAIGAFIVSGVVSLAVLAGAAFVVWKVLAHFGILS